MRVYTFPDISQHDVRKTLEKTRKASVVLLETPSPLQCEQLMPDSFLRLS